MSSDSSPQSPPQATASVRDSAGYEWEELATPADGGENLLPPPKPVHEVSKQLCGYLHKQSQKGLLKVWKTRWFVFDEQTCCLYYSNEKNESAQGKIDISSATLTYDVENLPKHQFEILSEGKLTSVQASSNEVMIYWLTTLQKKRRKFSAKRKKHILDDTNHEVNTASHGGLLGGMATPLEEEEEESLNEASLPVPVDLEDRNAYEGIGGLLQGRKLRIPKFRPSSSVGGGGLSPNFQRRSSEGHTLIPSSIAENSPEPSPLADTSIENGQSLSTDAPLRPNKLSGKNITNRLSMMSNILMNRGSKSFKSTSEACPNCQKAQENITYLENELSVKEREVKDRDEINEFLRKEIRLGDMREKVKVELTDSPRTSKKNNNKVDVLLQREQTIEQLQSMLETACVTRDSLQDQLAAQTKELTGTKEQVELFMEALTAKDHVVVDLTNQLFQLEHKGQILADPQEAMLPQSLELELKNTKEALEAYKEQNKFLSSEMVELHAIRSDEKETMRAHSSKMHELEAELYKIKSKYVILLKESQEPELDGAPITDKQELVAQMLQEVLEGDDKELRDTRDRSSSYDDYGFSQQCVGVDRELDANPLEARARKLDSKARSAESAIDETLVSHKAKWANQMAMLTGSEGVRLHRSDELKQLIRNGIPQDHRSKVWRWIIKDILKSKYKEGKYEEILHEHASQPSVAVNQIELDLLRTLPTNKYYDKPDAQGIDKLRRVLVAFSWYDPNVGYCQGLNRLAAIALLFLEEEDSFWCLVAIVQHLLPQDYYSRTLLGSQTDQRVLKELLQLRAGKLSQHLSLCEIDFSLITFNWFHTIYVDNLPVETMLRIWDTFLYEGSKVLFRFALAIFKHNEEKILEKTTSIGIFNHLRTMCQHSTDVETLVKFGFNAERNFSKKWIMTKRQHYRQQIQVELEKLDAQRRTTPPQQRVARCVEQNKATSDLISFNSKEDLCEGMFIQADSADCSDTEDPLMSDTQL